MGIFIGNRRLKRLSDADQRLLRDQAREAARWQRTFMSERNETALAEMQRRYGVHVSHVDVDELRAKARPVQDRVAATLQLQDLLAKVRAAGG